MSSQPREFSYLTKWIIRVVSDLKNDLNKQHPEYFEGVDLESFQSFMPVIFEHELVTLLLSFTPIYMEKVFFKLYNTKFDNIPNSKELLKKAMTVINTVSLSDKTYRSVTLYSSHILDLLKPDEGV